MATTPPLRRVKSTRVKPAAAIMSAKTSAEGNLRIELDEIAIGRPVARHDLAHRRNGGEGIDIVGVIQHRQVDAREFEAEKAAAALNHPIGFAQRLLDARHVADAEGDRIGVESPVGKRQRLRVGFDEPHLVVEPALLRALNADAQHVGVDVGNGDARLRPACPRHPEGDVARAAGDVEMGEGARNRGMRLGDKNVLPYPVQAEGHQIVHHVVTVGDLVEHRVHQSLLLLHSNGALAEMRMIRRFRHRISP